MQRAVQIIKVQWRVINGREIQGQQLAIQHHKSISWHKIYVASGGGYARSTLDRIYGDFLKIRLHLPIPSQLVNVTESHL